MNQIKGIDNVLFPVGDLARARAHYSGLGLVERFALPDAGIALYAVGNERPGILVREQSGVPESGPHPSRLWLEVEDARESARAIPESPLAPPFRVRTGWVVEYADPWGNVVGLTDYAFDPDRARGARDD